MKYLILLFLSGCATLIPDTYLSTEQYDFCQKACTQYGGLTHAGKTILGDKKSCICKNDVIIDYNAEITSKKRSEIEADE